MQDNLLERLNKEQLEAVTHTDGPLMIIAGAGTGKTSVVTHRIAWLIEQGHAKPDELLALTFTEKAATEMEERVDHLLPIGYVDLWISTFHAFCERILRAHAIDIGLPHEFKLLTEVDVLLLMRKNFDAFDLDYYKPRGNPTRFLKALLNHFSRLKDEVITPSMYLDYAEQLKMDADSAESVAASEEGAQMAEIARVSEVANAYHTYQQILLEHQAFDFADLVLYTIELLRQRPEIRRMYQQQFKFLLVDEFQDTNTAQYELIKLLTNDRQNITVVGDDDQSIYKFRGASLSNIMQFKTDFPKAKHIVLTQNYRSAGRILSHAYTLIQANNPNRLEVQENIHKELQSNTESEGFVEHIHVPAIDDEVRVVLERISQLRKEGANWNDFAILVRANDSAEPFTHALERAGVPYRFLAMNGLYVKPIILDALAWMKLINLPHESPSFYRVLSHPELGIKESDLMELSLYARRKASSLYDSARLNATNPKISPESSTRIHEILSTLHALQELAKRKPVSELFVEIMKQSGLLGAVRMLGEGAQQEQFSYLNQFFKRIKAFEITNDEKTLIHFMEDFAHERDAGEVGSLEADVEDGPDVVNIMTIHASKGLEFTYVFLVNLVEQRFPSTRRSEPISIPDGLANQPPASTEEHVAEERRLFYVALTRAKEGLVLLSADDYGGTRKRKPSRFIEEMQIETKRVTTETFEDALEASAKHDSETSNRSLTYTLPSALSFTQIAAFTTCPLQYKFAHILKVPVFGRHSLSFGKTMHNTLQHFTQQMFNAQSSPQASLFEQTTTPVTVPSEKDLLALYEDQWIDEWYPDEQTKSDYKEQGRVSLTEYRNTLAQNPPTIAFIEKGFTLKIGGTVLRGRIDRIDHVEDGVEIIDYKTGTPKEKLDWKDKRQLVLYQLAAEQCFDPPLRVKRLTYHYLENNTSVSFEATEKDKEKLTNEILDTVAALTETDFAPTPGFHCGYCDFKDICEFSEA